MPTVIEELVIDEISLVDAPANKAARVLLHKRDERVGGEMGSVTEDLRKALRESSSDTTRDRAMKALLSRQLDAGVIKVEAVAATLILEARAADIRKRRPELSPEQALRKALDEPENEALVRALRE